MTKQLSATGMECSEYQKLLENSAATRFAWRKLQAEMCWTRLVPKEIADELLRLQAKYARAYTLLQKHVHACGQCEPLSRIA